MQGVGGSSPLSPTKLDHVPEQSMKCIVELFGNDRNGRKMIAWGRRIGCADVGYVFDPERRKVATRLLVDDDNPLQKSYLLEIVDNPVGVKAIVSMSP